MYVDDGLIFIPLLFAVLFFVLFKRTSKLKKRVLEIEKKFNGATDNLKDVTKNATISHLTEEKTSDVSVENIKEGVRSAIDDIQQIHGDKTSNNEVEQVSVKNDLDIIRRFGRWLKEEWMMKLGGMLIVFGLAWFVNYAFESNWVGPMGRIAIGFVIGAFIIALGRYRISSYVYQGGVLMFVGAVIMIFTVWVGSTDKYAFFSEWVAMAMMFAISSVLGITSVVFRRVPLAYANILLVAVAPFFVVDTMSFSSDAYFVKLLAYLLTLTLGAIWVAIVTGWRQIILMVLLTLCIYSSLGNFDKSGVLFAFIFASIFFLSSLFGMWKDVKTRSYDLATAVISGMFLIVWIFLAVPDEWITVLLEIWSLVFALGSYLTFKKGASSNFFFAYAGVSAMYIAVVIAMLFNSDAHLVWAYFIEALVIIHVGYRIGKKVRSIPFLSIFMVVPLFLSLDGSMYWRWHGLINEYSVVLLTAIGSCVWLANYFKKISATASKEYVHSLTRYANVALTVALLYVLIFVYCASQVLFKGENALTITMFVYSIIGSALYIDGKRKEEKGKRIIGGLLVGITAICLMFIVVWVLGVFGRVTSFVAIGLLLMFVAWHEHGLFNKNKEKK